MARTKKSIILTIPEANKAVKEAKKKLAAADTSLYKTTKDHKKIEDKIWKEHIRPAEKALDKAEAVLAKLEHKEFDATLDA